MINLSKQSDEVVVMLVRSTDKEAFHELIKRYQDKLLRYARTIMSDDHLAADAVQQALIKAYINLNGFDTKKKFSSWMYRIVHNEAISLLRTLKRREPIDEYPDLESNSTIEDSFVTAELIQRTHDCLNKMPLLYKEPLVLFFLEEKSYSEIGDVLKIPTGTVGTRINRAKSILKHICQKKQ